MGIAPNAAAESAASVGQASGMQLGPLASELATRISLGQIAAPTDAEGWKALVAQYTGGGQGDSSSGIAAPEPTSHGAVTSLTTPVAQNGTATDSAPTTGSNASEVDKFLAAIRQHESGGNYTAFNAAGGASGAYQYIQSTWSSYARAAGFAQYANGPASEAPPAVQDAVAKYNAEKLFQDSGSWKTAAESWYYPAWANDPTKQNDVPYPSAGNTLTIGAYGDLITKQMGVTQPGPQGVSSPGAPGYGLGHGSASAVDFARSVLGTPYVWGGEGPTGFDCSGLVQEAFAKAGVNLPRTAQEQYNATQKLPPGTEPQAGDLVFYGKGPTSVEHVGIYIGNGQMIDAPYTGAAVRAEPLWGGEVGFTRPTDAGGTTVKPTAASSGSVHDYYSMLSQVQSALSKIGGAA